MSNKVYWVTAGANFTVNGTNFHWHIVSEQYSTANINCSNIFGDLFVKGTVNAAGTINGNVNVGSCPTVEWLMGKNVEHIFG